MTETTVQESEAQARPSTAHRTARNAFVTFVALEGVAGTVYLYLGRHLWFFLDDWDFLVDRKAFDLGDLFRSHDGHWSTLPILVYRFLWWTGGLRSYFVYQVLATGLYLVGALLLRTVMRRAGVRPWTATLVAGVFVLFGTAYQDILQAFQMSFNGSIVFGLVQLLLADHDGPVDQRDCFGLLAGLAALMSSGVGVAMVVVVGISALIRRGWRVALLHTLPLGAIFLTWYLAIGNDQPNPHPSIFDIAHFMAQTIATTFRQAGRVPGVGVLLAVMLAAGLVVAVFRTNRAKIRSTLAMPVALLSGAFVFVAFTAIGRTGMTLVVQSRYEHVIFALVIPAFGVAADALMRWRRPLIAPVVIVLVIGVPGNVLALNNYVNTPDARGEGQYRAMIETLPRLPIAKKVRRSVQPETVTGFRITLGWLLDGAASGRIPSPGRLDPQQVALSTLRLQVQQHGGPDERGVCRPVGAGVDVHLDAGGAITVNGTSMNQIVIVPLGTDIPNGRGIAFHPNFGNTLVARLPAAFRLAPTGRDPATVCGSAAVMQHVEAPADR